MSSDINKKIDDALMAFYIEADRQTIDELLNEEISNSNDFEKKKKQILFRVKATVQKRRNERLLEIVDKIKIALDQGIEKPVSMLKSLILGNSTPALYRNLDKLSREDIVQIIKDKNLVNLLEELENNDKTK